MSYDGCHSNKKNMTSCQHNVIHFKNKTIAIQFQATPKQLSNTRVDLENEVAYKSKTLQVFESTA